MDKQRPPHPRRGRRSPLAEQLRVVSPGVPVRFGDVTAWQVFARDSRAHDAAQQPVVAGTRPKDEGGPKYSPFLILKVPLETPVTETREAIQWALNYFREMTPPGVAYPTTLAQLRRAARARHGSRSGGKLAHRKRNEWIKAEYERLGQTGAPEAERYQRIREALLGFKRERPEIFGPWLRDNKQDLFNLDEDTIKKIVHHPLPPG